MTTCLIWKFGNKFKKKIIRRTKTTFYRFDGLTQTLEEYVIQLVSKSNEFL